MQYEKHNFLHQARKKLGKIRRSVFKINDAYWYYKYLAKEDHVRVANEPGFRVEFSNNDETVQWIKNHHNTFPWIYIPREIEYAEKFNHFYPSLKYQGEIIGFTKIAVVRAYIADYEDEIILDDDEAFIYDTFVLPEFRRRYMGRFMLSHIFKKLQRNGIAFIYCHIPGWNIASSKLYQNMGFRRISYVKYMRLLKFRYFSRKPNIVKERARRQIELLSSNH